jgi:hypothetical protein
MQDPNQIWEFGRWIARRDPGSARLSWSGGEVVLGVRQGRIHSAVGLDSGELASRLGCRGAGNDDLLAEARALGQQRHIPETRAMGKAKEILQEALHQWLLDPDRQFSVETGEPPEADGATISITHALVELVLADTEHNVASAILPDQAVRLERSKGFLELYAPLRLSEEADLIVAGIAGDITAKDIARKSPHRPEEVVRLVAALVTTGILKASPPPVPGDDLEWSGADFSHEDPPPRKIPVWMIGAAAALLLIVITVVAFVLLRGGDAEETAVVGSGDWGIVVEMGCEPQDLQRMLRKRSLERKSLRTVKADPTDDDTCFRLVWGSFPNRTAAEEAMDEVPPNLIEDGFQPHVIEVIETDADGDIGGGD